MWSRTVVTAAALAVLAAGCASRTAKPARPRPGDTVSPRLYHAGPWKAGTAVTLMTRLVASGPDGEAILRPDEVPEGAAVSAEVTFLAGGNVLGREQVTFVPPPC